MIVQVLSFTVLGRMHTTVAVGGRTPGDRLHQISSTTMTLPEDYREWSDGDLMDWVAYAIAELAHEA